MDEMTRYETARQCAQKFNPPSSDEIARTISNDLTYALTGQGLATDIANSVSGELVPRLLGQGLATDIAEAVAKAQGVVPAKSGVPSEAVCLFQDGGEWFAVHPDYTDMMASPYGCGDTIMEAVDALPAKEPEKSND